MSNKIPPGQAAVLKAFRERFGSDSVPVKQAIAMVCVSTGYGIPTVATLLGKARLSGRIDSYYERGLHYYQLPKEAAQ